MLRYEERADRHRGKGFAPEPVCPFFKVPFYARGCLPFIEASIEGTAIVAFGPKAHGAQGVLPLHAATEHIEAVRKARRKRRSGNRRDRAFQELVRQAGLCVEPRARRRVPAEARAQAALETVRVAGGRVQPGAVAVAGDIDALPGQLRLRRER